MSLNIVRRFHNLLHVSDILKSNGITMYEFIISDMTETSMQRTFSCEEPSLLDFRLWTEAIHCLCAGTTHLSYPLGKYLSQPHLPS